ncbi:hypothetical protein GSI_06797 [Ganoderma sinense ZZ0214-1]|uniref:Uncharacterized protein n=1 Tax=Ganoderma sinense ZZ0214-1 TaxID=1077348 RepID=A0A2G8SE98_9APHY|nr:hypothetical protein GSI_06797 [Ganoderma sinense ZZ0214-1]
MNNVGLKSRFIKRGRFEGIDKSHSVLQLLEQGLWEVTSLVMTPKLRVFLFLILVGARGIWEVTWWIREVAWWI